MPDTPSYLRAADAGYAKLFNVTTDWTAKSQWLMREERPPAPLATVSPNPSSGASVSSGEPAVTLKGRSVYYGALLYLADLAGSLWLAILAQAVVAAVAITLTLSALHRASGTTARAPPSLLIGVGLAVATPLGFFVSYLMPDLFGALGLLAMMNLLFLRQQLSRRARAFFLAVLAFAVLSHSVNLTFTLLLLLTIVAVRLILRRGPTSPALLAVAGCVAIGFAGQLAFDLTVKRLTGAAPVRPPFVAMRLIADGPGLDFLREHCASQPFIYCRLDTTRPAHSDTLLWSPDPQHSLFRGLSYADQRAAAAQQTRFVLAVAQDRPWSVVTALSRDVLQQLFSFDLLGFNYGDGMRQRYASAVPERLLEPMRQTEAYKGTLALRPTEIATVLVTIVSLVAILLFLRRSRTDSSLGNLRGACLFILFAVLLNAALCGALSGPKGRYQMRLIWVLPVLAAGVFVTRRNDARAGQHAV
ncbi:hypothetical protein [Sphingomonas arenae]|uniref:hypothetical protein n=1 Tax=Sphingomonas arenae TaxID=2812555 RepID=UPI0019678AF0|nr:hypothetical protein [Sphingomonas arenae]